MRNFIIIFFGFIAASFASDDINSYFNVGHLKYQIGLLRDLGNNEVGICGGALIHQLVVLTTAHCLNGVKAVRIFKGTTKIPKQIYEPGSIIVDSSSFKIHKNYIGSNVDDIATIILTDMVPIYEDVGLIPIATKYSNCGQGEAWASAWDFFTEILKFGSTNAISNYECGRIYRDFMDDKQICSSGYQAKSMCGSDSRGPLVFEDYNGKLVLCGLSTFPDEDCYADLPRIFTRASHYLENGWICENSFRYVGC